MYSWAQLFLFKRYPKQETRTKKKNNQTQRPLAIKINNQFRNFFVLFYFFIKSSCVVTKTKKQKLLTHTHRHRNSSKSEWFYFTEKWVYYKSEFYLFVTDESSKGLRFNLLYYNFCFVKFKSLKYIY